MDKKLKATVFIPVYNGEFDHLEETLNALYQQKTDFAWDVLITDSGSSDRSVEIIESFAKKHPNLRLVEISKEEYSHGKTRQWAAEQATGEIIVYLTQDAVPANNKWLHEMVKPFAISNKIVAVLGRQQPRQYCFPAMKYDINAVFSEQGSSDAITIWERTDESLRGNYAKDSFYSDVCSAAPREFLVNTIGYRPVKYSEDYEYGKDILDAGYLKAYNGNAVVEHSNDVRLKEYKNRIFDETYNVRINSGVTNQISSWFALKEVLKGSFKDTIRILKDKDYTLLRKAYWISVNPLFHFEKWRGIRLANRVFLDTDVKKYSLEERKVN